MIPLPVLLDSSLNQVRRLRPISVSIAENIVPLSTASIVIRKEDNVPERSWIRLYTVNGEAGVYRTRIPETGYDDKTLTLSLDHGICEVGDWIVREKADNAQKTLAAALQHYFTFYGGNKWQLGTVSVSGNVVVASSYQNLLTAMIAAVKQIPSAMLAFDFSTSPWTVSVVERGGSVSAEGRLSRNITKAKVRRDDSSLYTRVWLEGLGGKGVVGSMDADTIGIYGVIETNLSGSDYTQAQAQIVASAYLARHKRPVYSITIDGIDLSDITGEELDRIKIGKLYRLSIPEDSVTIDENVTSIRWPDVYGKPRSCSVTLAEEEETSVTFINKQNSYMSSYVDSVSATAKNTQADLDMLWTKTGVNDLGQQETLMTRIQANASGLAAEVTRATGAEASKLDKTESYQTVQSIISKAQSDAQQYATTAAAGCIAKTASYQTADAIVQVAVAEADTAAGNKYIAQTTRFQTADAIVQIAEAYTDGEVATRIAKTSAYQTVTDLLDKAATDAQGYATTAAAGCIAKTATYQSASAIVTAAVAAAETSAGNTYIAKTATYQTADAIVQTAEAYTDQESDSLYSELEQQADMISAVVTRRSGQNVIKIASIVAGINDQSGSFVKISADVVDIDGIVRATEARIDNLITGGTTATYIVTDAINVNQGFFYGASHTQLYPVSVTINGTNYVLLGATA